MQADIRVPRSNVLDLERIELLIGMAKNKELIFIQDLLALLESTVPPSIDLMRKSVSEQNLKLLKFEAHRLKGCSGNLGATGIQEQCSQLQNLESLKSMEINQISSEIESIARGFDNIKKELEVIALRFGTTQKSA